MSKLSFFIISLIIILSFGLFGSVLGMKGMLIGISIGLFIVLTTLMLNCKSSENCTSEN